ncbi:MAG: hypothetical protein PVJ39_04795 [Gammaproteobacteria bacterium]|jgi:hypothetical protein
MGKSAGDLITNSQTLTTPPTGAYWYLWDPSKAVGLRDQMILKSDFDAYIGTLKAALRWSDLIGGICSPGTDSDHDIDITAGERRDSTDTANIEFSSGTAAIDATFNAGTSTWGLYSGSSLSDGDTVHLFVVSIDAGGTGFYFDDDIGAANLPSGCTYFRRLDSYRIATGPVLLPQTQDGHIITSSAPVATYAVDLSGAQVTTATAFELPNVPKGITLNVSCAIGAIEADSQFIHIFGAGEEDYVPSSAAYTICTAPGADRGQTEIGAITNTDAQIYRRAASTANMTVLNVFAKSWYDSLGVFDGV